MLRARAFSSTILQELATSPANLEASNILDAYSLFPGHIGQLNDGTQAFTQATLGTGPEGIKTWARLPKELQPKEFSTYRDPRSFDESIIRSPRGPRPLGNTYNKS